jgi:Rad3-related DNA helicase
VGKALHSGRLKEEPLGEFDNIICDEAHKVHSEVCRALHVELDPRQVRRLIGVTIPRANAGIEDWRKWADRAADELALFSSEIRRNLSTEGFTSTAADTAKQLRRISEQLDAIRLMDDAVITKQAGRDGVERIIFNVVWARSSCAPLLYRGIERRLFMSATARPEDMELCDAPGTFTEYDSDFPVDSRPVWFWHGSPEVRVRYGMSADDERMWISRIDAILRTRAVDLERKGIIHCVSYDRMRAILEHSRYRDLFITHESGDAKYAVDELRAASGAAVLLSPAVQTAWISPTTTAGSSSSPSSLPIHAQRRHAAPQVRACRVGWIRDGMHPGAVHRSREPAPRRLVRDRHHR